MYMQHVKYRAVGNNRFILRRFSCESSAKEQSTGSVHILNSPRCPDVVKCPVEGARLCGDRTLNYSSLDSMKVTDSDCNNSITSVVHVACALYSSEFI